MHDPDHVRVDADEARERLERRAGREKAARQEAERIANQAIRKLADARAEAHRRAESLQTALDQLQELETLRQDIINTVAHVLQTPTTSLLMRLHAATQREGDARDQALAAAYDVAKTLGRATADVVRLAQINAGLIRPEFRETNATAVVAAVVDDLSRHGHDVSFTGGRDVAIAADTVLLSEAVRLLVELAIDAAPGVEVLVRDTDTCAIHITHGGASLDTTAGSTTPDLEGPAGLKWLQASGITNALHGTITYEPTSDVGPAFVLRLGHSD